MQKIPNVHTQQRTFQAPVYHDFNKDHGQYYQITTKVLSVNSKTMFTYEHNTYKLMIQDAEIGIKTNNSVKKDWRLRFNIIFTKHNTDVQTYKHWRIGMQTLTYCNSAPKPGRTI